MPTVIAGKPVSEATLVLRELIAILHGTKYVADHFEVDRDTIDDWSRDGIPRDQHVRLRQLQRKYEGFSPGRSQDPCYSDDMHFSVPH